MPSDIHSAQSSLCRIFTHPARIEILEALGSGERSVSELARLTKLAQPTVSQHLAVLRHAGVVTTRREGTSVHYGVADARIMEACHLLRSVLLERLESLGEKARRARPARPRASRPARPRASRPARRKP
jgi:ArsR family transcriptional regulator, virulence genes transcriptional regulator